jgi:putative ABC transport system permease protein
VASAADASAGYAIGQRLTVVPGGMPVTVVGLADDTQFNVQPTLFVSWATYEDLVRSTNPDATAVLPNLVGVEPMSGVDPTDLAALISEQVGGVEALDRATAVASLPGVSSIQQSFAIILGLAFVVVIILTGFFFLIITVQKTASLTLLRAVGAGSWFLLRNLLFQVLLVIGAALVIAIPLTIFAVSAASSAAFAATTDPSVLLITSVSILVLGVVASIGAMRRVTKIDPAAATARMAGGGLS